MESREAEGRLPFRELMALDEVKPLMFRSIAMAFGPGGKISAYGGHVFAQAVYAASKTVPKGFVVHVCTYQ